MRHERLYEGQTLAGHQFFEPSTMRFLRCFKQIF